VTQFVCRRCAADDIEIFLGDQPQDGVVPIAEMMETPCAWTSSF
jgi:hypothetical protein